MDTSETIGDQDPDTIESTDPVDTPDAENDTDAPDMDVDPEEAIVDGLEQLRLAAIALEAREDVVLAYHTDTAVDALEEAVTVIQKREDHEGRRQDGDAA